MPNMRTLVGRHVYLKTVSTNYVLAVRLPHTVSVDNAKAKWKSRDSVLVIRLHVADGQTR